jgi:NADH:ubiquinone oxidoreductase subunit 4 (subunit M)
MTYPVPNMLPALPEIWVLSMACVILMVDLYAKPHRMIAHLLCQATLIGAALLTMARLSMAPELTFSNMFVHDHLSDLLKLAFYLVIFFVFTYSREYIRERGMYRVEYFVLGLFALVGMMIVASASHLLTLYLGLELLALSLYAMVAFQRDSSQATEAAMKYFVLGAVSSGMLLYGMSILYGLTGTLEIALVKDAVARAGSENVVLIFSLVFVIVAIAFKIGAVPFHMWVPDVYHGAPTSVTLYIGTAPKIAGFALVMRLLVGGLEDLAVSWRDMLIILSVLSMALGNIVAIAQSNIKRMLAYSSISHMVQLGAVLRNGLRRHECRDVRHDYLVIAHGVRGRTAQRLPRLESEEPMVCVYNAAADVFHGRCAAYCRLLCQAAGDSVIDRGGLNLAGSDGRCPGGDRCLLLSARRQADVFRGCRGSGADCCQYGYARPDRRERTRAAAGHALGRCDYRPVQ